MKKIKILTPILGITSIATIAMPLSGCSQSQEFTVKFDTQGGSTIADAKVKKDSVVSRPEDPTKDKCRFGDWYTDAECNTPFDFNTKITGDITLYAGWINRCTISFSCSDGITLTGQTSVEVDTNTKWKDVEKPTVSVPSGYEDLGWYNNLDEITDETVITSDFSARYVGYQYEEIFVDVTVKTAKAEYKDNAYVQGGTWAGFKEYYEITEDPQKEGFDFIGWYDGDTKVEDDYEFKIGTTSTTIEAKFKETDKTVTFAKTDGVTFDPVDPEPVVVEHGTTWGNVSKPTVTVDDANYFDLGWHIEGEYLELEDDTPITSDITAKYYAIAKSAVLVDVNIVIDGTTYPTQYLQNGTWAGFKEYWSVPTPTKEGYTFEGWYNGKTKLTNDWTFPTTGPVIIEAKFTINQYTVNFAVDDGAEFKSTPQPVTVNYKTKWSAITKPEVVLKEAHIENGWYSDKTGKMTDDSEILGNTTVTYRTHDVSSYKVQVTVEVLDKTYAAVEYQCTKTWGDFKKEYITQDPERDGYSFKGWSIDGTKIDDSYVFPLDKREVTVKAIMEVNNFETDSWTTVCKISQQGGDEKGLELLHKYYKIYCDNNTAYPGTLIGYTRDIKFGDQTYKATVIDENHDGLYTDKNKKAPLTFSVDRAAWYKGEWCRNGSPYNVWFNVSDLHKYTVNYAQEKIEEANPGIKMRQLTKNASQKDLSKWKTIDYYCYTFPFTCTELNLNGKRTEGTVYKYYQSCPRKGADPKRVKYSLSGEPSAYWLSSPDTSGEDKAFLVQTDGSVTTHAVYDSGEYCFGFCI